MIFLVLNSFIIFSLQFCTIRFLTRSKLLSSSWRKRIRW